MGTRNGVRPAERMALARMELRRLAATDLQALHEAKNESFERLHAWMPWAAEPATLERDAEFLRDSAREWQDGTDYGYAMVGAGGLLVGVISMFTRQGPGSLEIGYWVRTGHTRRGLATEAAGALTRQAFALPGVEWTEIRCDEANVASAAVPAKLGYRLDRIEERPPRAPSETHRHMVWVMTRERFATVPVG